jgi:hypothetical protein
LFRKEGIKRLAIRNGLTTGDELGGWGFKGEVQCVFCRSCLESIDHLFFECGFSKRLWLALMEKCLLYTPPYSWSEVLNLGIKE